MELLIAIFFTGIGIFGGMFFIWKNHQTELRSHPQRSKSK